MNSLNITKDQARKIAAALYPPTNYLVRLRNRMHERVFPHDDPLYRLVCDAYEAMNRLRLHVNNLSCSGTWQPSAPPVGGGRPDLDNLRAGRDLPGRLGEEPSRQTAKWPDIWPNGRSKKCYGVVCRRGRSDCSVFGSNSTAQHTEVHNPHDCARSRF
jgi:hypothetical protein